MCVRACFYRTCLRGIKTKENTAHFNAKHHASMRRTTPPRRSSLCLPACPLIPEQSVDFRLNWRNETSLYNISYMICILQSASMLHAVFCVENLYIIKSRFSQVASVFLRNGGRFVCFGPMPSVKTLCPRLRSHDPALDACAIMVQSL